MDSRVTCYSNPGGRRYYAPGTDKLVFGAGIATGDITASRVGNSLVIRVNDSNNAGATDQITIENWSSNAYRIEQVQFADGTAKNDAWLDSLVTAAPTGVDQTLVTNEDTVYTLNVVDFGFSSKNFINYFSAVRIDSLPVAGNLKLSGSIVIAAQIISATDLAAGHLVFTPATNANGSGYAGFDFSVGDQNGVFDAVPNTIIFNVTPVNDAPVLSGAIATLTRGVEDTVYSITQAILLAGFTDVDGNTLSVTGLTTSNGTLSAFNVATGSWTFTPNANYNGTVNLSYGVSDGTAAPVAATQSFTLAAVNDAPTGAVTVSGTATQNQTLTAANTLADVDGLGTMSYQWQSSTNGTTWTPIAAATANTFTLGAAQVGAQVRVQVSYTDGQGTAESVTSALRRPSPQPLTRSQVPQQQTR